MARMLNTKFGLVSPTESDCLGHLDKEFKDGRWVHERPKKKPKPRQPIITVWRKRDGRD